MNNSSQDTLRRVDAVLDGQASPEEVRALEERLAADPALREQYEDSKRIFDALGTMPERRVDELQIIVPPGPGGYVGFAVLVGGVRIIPYLSDQWIITAGESISWPLEDQPTSGAWSVAGYNTGTNTHSVYFPFLLSLVTDPAATGLIPFDVAAVNDLAPSQ